MEDYIFVCYAGEDIEFTLSLATTMEASGLPVWVDQWEIAPGVNWSRSIDAAIAECAEFVVVLSPAAVASDDVQGQWLTALADDKSIVPILRTACRIPPRLRVFPAVDFNGQGPSDEPHLQELVRTLGRQVRSLDKKPQVDKDNLDKAAHRLVEAFQTSSHRFQTVVALTQASRLSEREVEETLRKYPKVFRQARLPDKNQRPLYVLRFPAPQLEEKS